MANPDFETLLNELVPKAQYFLEKYKEFYPFGAYVETNGKIVHTMSGTGDEHPPSQELIDILVAAFREKAEKAESRAAGICLDSRITQPGQTDKTDAICLRLECATEDPIELFLPYKKGWFGKINYGEILPSPGDSMIFPHS